MSTQFEVYRLDLFDKNSSSYICPAFSVRPVLQEQFNYIGAKIDRSYQKKIATLGDALLIYHLKNLCLLHCFSP
jgi:hypothetical protein